ncbi:cell division protein ZipA C-terminal FtsZ-binding domain-containing protein [Orrella sp. 11846]|uniref:cell division protein ZipA C-terminal FtsZ-binding domain-containing protein n=1 Tax=Orrella sp. 11846 TaxID=3409913 RepID=UPI003B5C65CD
MSELQISLIVLGIIVILGVVLYNGWQDRRMRKSMEKHLPAVDEDPLLSEGSTEDLSRREPGLSRLGLQKDDLDAPEEPVSGEASEPLEAGAPVVEPDPLVESVILLEFITPLSGERLLAVLREIPEIATKPVRFFVQTEDGGLRMTIAPKTQYISLQLAVLLADRAGPLGPEDWSKVWGLASDLGETLEARVLGPDPDEVVAKAAGLDATCAQLDMQVSLNLVLERSASPEQVYSQAESMGFMATASGLAWIDEDGIENFVLTRTDGQPFDANRPLDRLSLLLDVPRSHAKDKPFSHMTDIAVELAQRLQAVVVDDQDQPLVPGAEKAIDAHLIKLYQDLEIVGLQAGSERARRVFA